jgi:hypothetical protein
MDWAIELRFQGLCAEYYLHFHSIFDWFVVVPKKSRGKWLWWGDPRHFSSDFSRHKDESSAFSSHIFFHYVSCYKAYLLYSFSF